MQRVERIYNQQITKIFLDYEPIKQQTTSLLLVTCRCCVVDVFFLFCLSNNILCCHSFLSSFALLSVGSMSIYSLIDPDTNHGCYENY